MIRSLSWDAQGEGLFVQQCATGAGLLLHVGLNGESSVLRKIRASCDGWALPSPDGRQLAFVEWTSTGNLWMLRR
jgi:hypothetical protein